MSELSWRTKMKRECGDRRRLPSLRRGGAIRQRNPGSPRFEQTTGRSAIEWGNPPALAGIPKQSLFKKPWKICEKSRVERFLEQECDEWHADCFLLFSRSGENQPRSAGETRARLIRAFEEYADWKGSRVGMQPSRASASLTSRLLFFFAFSQAVAGLQFLLTPGHQGVAGGCPLCKRSVSALDRRILVIAGAQEKFKTRIDLNHEF